MSEISFYQMNNKDSNHLLYSTSIHQQPHIIKKSNKEIKDVIRHFKQVNELLNSSESLTSYDYYDINDQAFTNCMRGYDHARSMHASGITCAQKFMHDIDWQHNWKLLIACPHRPLYFKKIRTTTTIVVVPNTCRHSTVFNPQSFVPLHPYLKFQVCLIDLSKSDIQIPFDLQIDNSIQ